LIKILLGQQNPSAKNEECAFSLSNQTEQLNGAAVAGTREQLIGQCNQLIALFLAVMMPCSSMISHSVVIHFLSDRELSFKSS